MHEEDWQALRDTRLRALADAPSAFGTTHAEAVVRPEAWWRQRAADAAAGPEQAMFLAWADDQPVGIAGAFREGSTVPGDLDVDRSATTRRRHRRGRCSRPRWRSPADAEVVLSVTDGNEAARRLYERFGFVATGFTEPLRSNPALQIHELRLVR